MLLEDEGQYNRLGQKAVQVWELNQPSATTAGQVDNERSLSVMHINHHHYADLIISNLPTCVYQICTRLPYLIQSIQPLDDTWKNHGLVRQLITKLFKYENMLKNVWERVR
jgi:hypothetical protein